VDAYANMGFDYLSALVYWCGGKSVGLLDLEQRGHEEAPDPAIDAVVLIEKQPIVAVLAGQSQTRRDGERIDVDHIVASRAASDLLGAKVMGVPTPGPARRCPSGRAPARSERGPAWRRARSPHDSSEAP